jgi:Flp pilus assembly protein TadD
MIKESRAGAAAKAATGAHASAVNGPAPTPESDAFLVRWGTFLAGSIVVFAALAAYHNSFSGPFIFDDQTAVPDNATIRHWVSALSPPAHTGVGGRPILNLTFAFNYMLGGLDVRGYHAVNLIIHALAGLTLFGIVRRILFRLRLHKAGVPTPNPQAIDQGPSFAEATLLALAVAVIWVVHPLQTQAVTYISERAECLMGLFYLLTLYCFIRSVEAIAPVRWQILSVAACLLGVLSKEIIVTAPVMVLLYDRTFVAGSFREAWRQRWRYYLGLTGTWLLLVRLMTGLAQRGAGFDQGITWWDYALTSCRSVVLYLKLAIWPNPLVFDRGAGVIHSAMNALPYASILVVVVTALAIAFWRWPTIGFAGAWFFVILAPTSSVVPLAFQPMAESRMYLPLAAVIGLVVLGLYTWIGRRSAIVFAAAAVGLGWLTTQRNNDYRSEQAIWKDTVAKCPENVRAHYDYGKVLEKIPGQTDEAILQYQAVLQLQPNHFAVDAHEILGTLLRQEGDISSAIIQFNAALKMDPNFAEAHNGLGMSLRQEGDIYAAMAEYETALRIKPDFAEAHNNLGSALSKIPGRLQDETAEFEAALKIRPDFVEAHYNLGNVLVQQEQYSAACEQYNEALRLNPDYIQAYANLGATLVRMGRLNEALVQFEAALRIKPDDPIIRRNIQVIQNMLLETQEKNSGEHPVL